VTLQGTDNGVVVTMVMPEYKYLYLRTVARSHEKLLYKVKAGDMVKDTLINEAIAMRTIIESTKKEVVK